MLQEIRNPGLVGWVYRDRQNIFQRCSTKRTDSAKVSLHTFCHLNSGWRVFFSLSINRVTFLPLVLHPILQNQYKKGQIYSVAKVSSEITDPKDGAGVESIANEKCELGGYGM